jgi:hypothetical protein
MTGNLLAGQAATDQREYLLLTSRQPARSGTMNARLRHERAGERRDRGARRDPNAVFLFGAFTEHNDANTLRAKPIGRGLGCRHVPVENDAVGGLSVTLGIGRRGDRAERNDTANAREAGCDPFRDHGVTVSNEDHTGAHD